MRGRLGSRPSALRCLLAQARSTSPLWFFSAYVSPLGLPKTRPVDRRQVGIRRPGQRIFGVELGALGKDAAKPEGLHERIANAAIIRRIEVSRNRDDGAQEIAERNVDGRAVIERAGTQLEEEHRRLGGVAG